ncbi:MAG: AAA family ATPase [Clostridiales bacterium]|nr:AAA family ATPase [Clostridiales bacterium]MCF8023271.1 AAA family ATPase [Clostridiales bacterium]
MLVGFRWGSNSINRDSARDNSYKKNKNGSNSLITNNSNADACFSVEDEKKELYDLIGLKNVKDNIEEICAFLEIQNKRKNQNLAAESQVLHMIFKGNPGTGKTTVARILARILYKLEILSKGHTLEVERADLVGEYIGHTAHKTREQIKKAVGGVLFIDEAYSLARGGYKDFGKESIDTLVKGMEEHKDSLVLILAGYRDEMETFLESNPGLRSRFPVQIDFPDYNTSELLKIADFMMEKKQYYLENGGREELGQVIEVESTKHRHSGNARLVRNIIERAMRLQAVRLTKKSHVTREELMKITRRDIASARNTC